MKRKFGVSLPEDVVKDIDEHAAYWGLDRSAMIVKIYREWFNVTKPLPKKSPKTKSDNAASIAA